MKFILYSILVLILAAPHLQAADKAGIILRDAKLYAKPFKDADTLAQLPATTTIIILKRKGGWYQIKSSDQQGWVRLTRVRLNRKAGSKQENNSGVGELLSGLATGRGKSSQDTTATAVKGLSEEELRNAEPDEAALNALDNYAVTDDTNDNSGLQTREIDFQPGTAQAPAIPGTSTKSDAEEDEE